MNFVITSPQEKEFKMYPGMLITYRVSPLNGIRMNWVTEIKHVKEKDYFIDEQRVGPYALWHHRHKFEETNAGILMTDDLHYALPFGGLGRIINRILVEKEINKIFTYRNEKIIEIFGRS